MAAQSIRGLFAIFPDAPDPLSVLNRVRGVLELAEEARNHKGDLLADIDGVVPDPLDRPRGKQHRHSPLPLVGVVADLQRQPEALPVEVVDHVVLADQVLRHLDVAPLEGPLRLADQRPGLPAHARISFTISSSAGGSLPDSGIILQMFTH